MSQKTEMVGSRIKYIRIGKRLSQTEVAHKVGISQAYLSNIESGRSHCTLENLIKIGELFRCPIRDFFVDVDKEYEKKDEDKELFSLLELATALLELKKKR